MNTIYKFPIDSQVKSYLKIPKEKIKNYVDNSYLLIPEKLTSLIEDFITYKKKYGTDKEKILLYKDMTIKYENIYELYFGWFNIAGLGINLPNEVNGVKIGIGYTEPFECLNNDDLLMISNWACDPNSYVGNEYWNGRLGTSGDPAAACCSYIPFMGNPDVNKIDRVVLL